MVDLLGDDWQEGDRQLRCVLSDNDSGADGRSLFEASRIASYMERFAAPLAARILELRRAGIVRSSFTAAVETRARERLGV